MKIGRLGGFSSPGEDPASLHTYQRLSETSATVALKACDSSQAEAPGLLGFVFVCFLVGIGFLVILCYFGWVWVLGFLFSLGLGCVAWFQAWLGGHLSKETSIYRRLGRICQLLVRQEWDL